MHREPRPEDFPALLGDVYDAALEPALWKALLPKLLHFVGATRGTLGIAGRSANAVEPTLSHELDPEHVARWQGEFAGFDPLYERVGMPPVGTVVRAWDVIPPDALRRMHHYRGVFRALGCDDYAVSALSDFPGGDFFSANRSESDGAFTDGDLARHRALAPHLARAVALHARLVRGASYASANEVLARLSQAVFLLGRGGRVLGTNAAAERLAAARRGLAIVGGVLTAGAGARAALARAIDGAIETAVGAGTRGASILRIAAGDARDATQLLIAPIPRHSREVIFSCERDGVLACVIASEPERAEPPSATAVSSALGLPPALARLAAAIAGGATIASYAASAGISENTARGSLKEIFARTGTHRQAELAALILRSVAALHREP